MDPISRLTGICEEKNIDTLLLSAPDNIEYFFGVRTIADTAILAVCDKNAREVKVYTSLLEYYRFKEVMEKENVRVIALSKRLKPRDAAVTDKGFGEIIGEYMDRKVGFDKGMESPLKTLLLEKIGGKAVDVSDVIWRMRMHKEDWEIDAIRKAIEITGKGIKEAVVNLREDITEARLAGFFEHRVRMENIDEYAFPPLILFKPGNSYPHNLPSNNRLGKRNLVLMDVGVKYNGRCSDITRMAIWGRPRREEKKTLEILAEAIDETVDKAEPGMKAEEIYRIAFSVIEKHGYAERFIHGLGHGFGILVHEKPYITSGVEDRVEPGTVFTIEPGIYIPGKYGVRIEEDALMTKKGVKLLSRDLQRIFTG